METGICQGLCRMSFRSPCTGIYCDVSGTSRVIGSRAVSGVATARCAGPGTIELLLRRLSSINCFVSAIPVNQREPGGRCGCERTVRATTTSRTATISTRPHHDPHHVPPRPAPRDSWRRHCQHTSRRAVARGRTSGGRRDVPPWPPRIRATALAAVDRTEGHALRAALTRTFGIQHNSNELSSDDEPENAHHAAAPRFVQRGPRWLYLSAHRQSLRYRDVRRF